MKKILLSTVLVLALALLPVKYASAETSQISDTYICAEYQGYIYEISDMYGICPELIMAIIEKESSGKAKARNGNCKGLMQVNENCHKDKIEEFNVTDIYDPYSNILIGTAYLLELFEEYEDVGMVLMVYNGDSKAKKYQQTGSLSKYAASILKRACELEELHY